MAKIIEEYNPQKIEIVKRMLGRQAEKGIPMAFEIYVDNFKVVMKTTDITEFDSYEELTTSETRCIKITVFNSLADTVGHTKYLFELKGGQSSEPAKLNGLGEVDINARIKESLAIERDRWDKEQLNNELDRTKLLLKEAEDYIDNLQTQIEQTKTKANHWGKLDLGLLAGSALEGVLRKNPQWLTKVPGLEGLAGAIEQESTEGVKQIPVQETEVSFKKKSESTPALSEDEQSYLNFGKHVAENFEDDEIRLLMKIIAELGKDTSKLKTVADLLDI
jgi:hypothetical protein